MNGLNPPAAPLSANFPRPSIRAQFVERRTYLRPKDEDGKRFETPDEALDRVIGHQRWLWEQQIGKKLNADQEAELAELRDLMAAKKVSASGRVKWMGGTEIIKERASAAFNCSFTTIKTPADMVDAFWLLLQGCGVGFKPLPGLLTGFPATLTEIEVVPSYRKDKGGAEHTESWVQDDVWYIRVGDSAMAWAKLMGKLMGDKPRVRKLVISLEELRPGGKRLRGYGWLSSGWEPLARALEGIANIMIAMADKVLSAINIGDIINWMGTVLSSRRSAQIWLLDDTSPEIEAFIDVKIGRWDYKLKDGTAWSPPADFNWMAKDAMEKLAQLAKAAGASHNGQREQSNNSIMFNSKPSKERIVDLLNRILDYGDPGFVNAEAARKRAPEMEGFNPCAEILLPSKGFCNLMQVAWHRFNGDFKGLLRAQYLAGRANYRQTCVSMRDGVLQLGWEDNQKLLRLCGVSPTGYVAWEHMNDAMALMDVRDAAIDGANSMADELGLQRPRRVTQVQPSGTSSKVMGLEGDEVHEGAHLALSRYVFNNVNFSIFDEMLPKLKAAGYHMWANPNDRTGMLVRFPVAYPESPLFTKKVIQIDGKDEEVEVNEEPAVQQLNRYKILMDNYVDHNCSITVSYDRHEIDEVADWFMANWDSYVGVSFLKRNDPTKSAEDLGFKYLPQQCVSRRMYEEYLATLSPVDLSEDQSFDMLDMADCATGACPVR